MTTAGRFLFGGGAADFAIKPSGASPFSPATAVAMWTAQTGGSNLTDLLKGDGVTAQTFVTSNSDGSLPLFYGPVGVISMWADAGAGNRYKVYPDPGVSYAPSTGAFGALAASGYGVVGDCNNTGATITISGGSLSQGTLSATPSDLKIGHTIVVGGSTGNMVVQSISGTTVTFTGAAGAAASAVPFIYGTDNTTAINNWISDCLTRRLAAVISNGRFLVTGTVGRLDGPTTAYAGLTIYCAGATTNTARQSYMAGNGGTSFIWGGDTVSKMWQWNRVDHVRWVGGVAMVAQPSYDPSGVFTTFANRCAQLYTVTQNSTPYTGTGHHHFDLMVVEDATLGGQHGENSGDNNCDTTTWGRLIANRCNQVWQFNNTQSIAHHIQWLHFISCPRGIVTNGGHLSIGQANLSLCDGTGGGTYSFEINGTTSGVGTEIGLLRSEQSSANVMSISGGQLVHIGVYQDEGNGGASVNKPLFAVNANGNGQGLLNVDVMYLDSYNSTPSLAPIQIGSGASATGRVNIGDLICTGPSGIPNLAQIFNTPANAVTDITVNAIKNLGGRSYNPVNTKLARGPVYLYGTTTSASGITLTLLGDGVLTNVFGYAPRLPVGYSIFDVYVINARSDSTFSVFRRTLEISTPSSGAPTVVSNVPVGTDAVQGTDALTGITATTTGHLLGIAVSGTTSITGVWQATATMRGFTAASDL